MNDYIKYTTRKGDTFDVLALDAYNDEMLSPLIIEANPEYCGVLVFEAGITLTIPKISRELVSSLPPWQRGG